MIELHVKLRDDAQKYKRCHIVMLVQFEEFKIDLKVGKVSHGSQVFNLRAKTLQVLTMLVNNAEHIVTKQQLLDEIWSDVVVQEQVLVQSIKEIRDILGSDVVKTYPRKGYQWVAPIQVITPSKLSGSFNQASLWSAIVVLVIALVGYLLVPFSSDKVNIDDSVLTQPDPLSVAVMPIDNQFQDNHHQWVALKGMDYLSRQLAEQSDLAVIAAENLLFAIERNQQFSSLTQQEQAFHLRKTLRADLIIATQVSGFPNDMSLKYHVYTPFNQQQGVIFSETVQQAIDKLVEKVATQYGHFAAKQSVPFAGHFENQAFARGMQLFMQREYRAAQPYFDTALNENPDLLVARRYLAASYANANQAAKGVELLRLNAELALSQNQIKEAFRSQLMRGFILINWPEQQQNRQAELQVAQQAIELALSLAQDQQDKLFIAYALEELGKIKRLQGQLEEAQSLLKQAISYHQQLTLPYSQTAALIELALVAAAKSQHQDMQGYFEQAMDIAQQHDVPSNKIWILLAQAEVLRQQDNQKAALDMAERAEQVAKSARDPKLVARVEAWFQQNRLYEIH